MLWTCSCRLALALGTLLGVACAAPATSPATGQPAAAAPQAAPTARPLESVRIGYPSRSLTFLAPLLARDQGYYQGQGLDVELNHVRTNVGIAALLSGELDYTESIGTNVRSALQGAPIKTVLVTMRAPAATVVARPEYAAMAQLRGRILGVDNIGSSNDQVTRLIVKHYGLDPQQDVQIVSLGDPPVRYEALRVGQIDAALLPLPFPVVARQEGYQLLVNAPDIVSMPQAGVGTLQTRLETQRDQVRRVAKAEIQALRHIRSRPEDAIRLIAELFDTDPETAAQAYAFVLRSYSEDGTVEREGLETIVEAEREQAKVAVPPPFEQIADVALAAEAQRELGLR